MFTKASPSLAVANRWGGTSSFLPFVVPIGAAVLAGTGGFAAATAIVDGVVAGEVAADGGDRTGADDLCLMDSHNVQPGLLVCFLVHCFVSFWGRCAQNYTKIYSKNYKNCRDGVAFDNFLIQFSYNFEAAGRPLVMLGSLRSKFSKNLFQKL